MSSIRAEPETTRPSREEARPTDAAKKGEERVIKVLVWDLDNTLWDGIILENDDVRLRDGAVEVLEALDSRGILHSIASRGDHELAMGKLKELGLDDYFLYPQINWESKAANVKRIAESINIGLDAVCFMDDQPFEREEVAFSLPQVMTLDSAELATIPRRAEFMPRFITDESRIRRKMYQADLERKKAEEASAAASEEFLATLGMEFTIARAGREDLKRAEELTVRTNQLNSTGLTYSYDELDAIRTSDDHLLLVASLVDKYGPYGKIGLALVEKGAQVWKLRLLLMSCRVMSRGVGTILLNHILSLAKEAGAKLQADFKPTERNRMMMITYKFAGFKQVAREGDLVVLEHDLERIQPHPAYVDVEILS